MSDQRCSDSDQSKRDIPSFIEPRPPAILNPFMRPRPQKGTNLLELFEEDSENGDEPEWVQVYLRLKPCLVKNNLYEVRSDRCLITSVDTATMGHGRRTQHNVSKMYTFSHIFGPDSDQREIFEHVVKDNLKKLPDGHNFTLLTYGASGSGKTYTLMGTVQAPGLVPRSLEYVFRVVDAAQSPVYKPLDGGSEKLDYYNQDNELQFVKRLRQVSAPLRDKYRRMSAQLRGDLTASRLDLTNRTRYYVWVSFVEIYNEAIYDLLSNCDRSKASSKLRIREDSNGNVYVKGATQAFVRSGSEAYDVLLAGKHNLQVAATGVHANSSRSHCIFTITMLTETEDGVRASCVRLCDLAGCERARNTRNTGARMQESRAINSSLHVLERCLHMLRRKQKKIDATLVPYRESKLTRLLGAGLSGARGEAVSMVVTLNPAPQYSHETRHVLQLAAVARDIQVNQTIAESSLESSTFGSSQDISESGAELMRLRADNERLHFELLRAQSCNKELMASMDEKQKEAAKIMEEVVAEAKDLTREYYETQLQALREEMEEMQEDYERQLREVTRSSDLRRISADAGTPNKSMQRKITELMTAIAILEEKLTAEKLARARAEEEVQHLRACIDERDEKAAENSAEHEDTISVDSASEEEEQNDEYNESLEPTFKKEDINRSKMLQRSFLNDSRHSNNSEKSNNTIGHADKDETLKDDVETDNDVSGEESSLKMDSVDHEIQDSSSKNDITVDVSKGNESSAYNSAFNLSQNDKSDAEIQFQNEVKCKSALLRGTYVVMDDEVKTSDDDKDSNKNNEQAESKCDNNNVTDDFKKPFTDALRKSQENIFKSFYKDLRTIKGSVKNEINDNNDSKPIKDMRKMKSTHSCDISLAQFEEIEKDTKTDDTKVQRQPSNEIFSNIKILNEKRTFFDDKTNGEMPKPNKDKTDFENVAVNIDVKKKVDEAKVFNDDRSPSIVKEDAGKNFEPSMIKKLLGESFTRQQETISIQNFAKPVKHASVDIFESPQIIREPETSIIDEGKSFASEVSMEVKSVTEILSKEDFTRSIKKERDSVEPMGQTQDVNTVFEKPDLQSKDNLSIFEKEKSNLQPKDKLSIFEQCVEKTVETDDTSKAQISVEDMRKSIEKLDFKEHFKKPVALTQITAAKMKQERLTVEPSNDDKEENNEIQFESVSASNNTVDDFEKIYKDITAPRATEFDLLVSQISTNTSIPDTNEQEMEKPIEPEKVVLKYNLRHPKGNTSVEKKENVSNKRDRSEKRDADLSLEKKADTEEVILLESKAKCSSAKPKRNLRLRRQKNQDDLDECEKLKDIVNLQKEFSDVTMDVPAPVKEVKDIESPEKTGEENLPPMMGIQSCPSKSVQRSRRKLFTPRPEPLEESMAASGDSNERVRVPRPSYHRTRARRKLN